MASRTKSLLIVLSVAVLAAGCGGQDQPRSPTSRGETPRETSPRQTIDDQTEETPTDKGLVIKATVANGEVETRSNEVDVPLGETVEIIVSSDRDDEVHVHGYDLFEPVKAGKSTRLRFTADIPGVFEVELEDAGLTLLELRVQ